MTGFGVAVEWANSSDGIERRKGWQLIMFSSQGLKQHIYNIRRFFLFKNQFAQETAANLFFPANSFKMTKLLVRINK
jgi:hypothetical protein